MENVEINVNLVMRPGLAPVSVLGRRPGAGPRQRLP